MARALRRSLPQHAIGALAMTYSPPDPADQKRLAELRGRIASGVSLVLSDDERRLLLNLFDASAAADALEREAAGDSK